MIGLEAYAEQADLHAAANPTSAIFHELSNPSAISFKQTAGRREANRPAPLPPLCHHKSGVILRGTAA
jgi:hypothetical protein